MKAPEYRRVQGLVRGLAILEALNAQPGASASVAELSRHTGLHRTTVKRSLETMRAVGYVHYASETNTYGATFRVRRLSDNFRDETWITDVAGPAIRRLTEKIRWPTDLMTLAEDHFIVRDTTHPHSPLSFSTGAFGARIPVLTSAVGRAWLAYCSAEERAVVLEVLRARQDDEGAKARDARYVRRLVDGTRARGYALNENAEGVKRGRIGTIAVPIVVSRRVIACINIVFLLRAVATRDIVQRHLADLQAAAHHIEAGVRQLRSSGRHPAQT